MSGRLLTISTQVDKALMKQLLYYEECRLSTCVTLPDLYQGQIG
jgi:hypothetical protein